METRIALIHAVTVAIEPVQDAFRQLWPEAECANILDDSLSRDRERAGFWVYLFPKLMHTMPSRISPTPMNLVRVSLS